MNFLKLSTVHFLALSLALNVVLLGLVGYLFQVEAPRPLAVTAPAPVTASPVATRIASENTEPPMAAVSSTSLPAPVVSYSAPVPTAQQSQGSWSVPAEFSASAPASAGPAPSEATVAHNANAPGNFFKFKNMVVAVEGESDDIEGTGPGLLVSVSDVAPQAAASGLPASANNSPASSSPSATQNQTQTSENQTVATDSGGTASAGTPRRRSGSPFTYEEELFRAKWGWGAFNAAQTAAAQAQAAASPTQ